MAHRQITRKDEDGNVKPLANRFASIAHVTVPDPDTGQARKRPVQLGEYFYTQGGADQAAIHFVQAVEIAKAAGLDDPIRAAKICMFGASGRAPKTVQRAYRPLTPPPNFAAAFGAAAAELAFGTSLVAAPTGLSATLLDAPGNWTTKCAEDRIDRIVLVDEIVRRYDDFLAERARTAAPSKRKAAESTHEHYMSGLKDFLRDFAGTPAEQIPRMTAVSWARQPKYEWKAQTVARMYNWARDTAGLVERNPFAGVSTRKQSSQAARPALSDAELERVRDACFEEHTTYGQCVWAMIVLAIVCGLRMREICALEWTWLNFDGEHSYIVVEEQLYPDRKPGDPKHREPEDERDWAPFPNTARQIVSALPRRLRLQDGTPTNRVLLSKDGLELNDGMIGDYWRPVRRLCGIDIPFRDLRDTFHTDLVKRNIHPAVAAAISRHRDDGRTHLANYVKLERRETFLGAVPALERPKPKPDPSVARLAERRAS